MTKGTMILDLDADDTSGMFMTVKLDVPIDWLLNHRRITLKIEDRTKNKAYNSSNNATK